ncbi:MAG: ankyrin repeat domain-containing protein, partial [Elusimicrobiaceae bacterium]|nr:ankyrin repeat domain-containing protein [Elusimicrobiaceae bacterium]
MKKRLIPVVSMICALACFSVVPAQAQHPTNEQLRVSWVVENIIKKGDLEGLKQELRRGDLRVNAADQNGNALLMHACKEGKDDMVSMLLANGANVNRQDKDGMTALMYAREPSTGKMLLDNGAAVNIKDKNGKTALMYAADCHPDLVKVLLDNGAAVNLQDKDGNTALMRSVKSANSEVTQIFLDYNADITIINHEG